MAVNAPEVTQKLLLSSLLNEQLMLSEEKKGNLAQELTNKESLDSFLDSFSKRENEEEDSEKQNEVRSFFSIYWFIWKLINWKGLNELLDLEGKAQ